MREFWNGVQVVFTAIGGWLGWFLGGCDGLLYALIAFVVIDYITGIMCAVVDKKLSSSVGFKGICKKVLIFALVGLGHILDTRVIGAGSVLRTAVIFSWFRCKSYKLHTAVPVPGVMYTPPSRERIADPTPELIAYREKYNRPTPPRPMICSDIRIPREQPKKAFVQAWNLIVGKKTRYQASLQRTVITTENPLTRYRAKEMISLLDTVGRIKEFDFQLMLRTLDFVEVSPPDKLSFVFQCGIRITV